MSKTSAIAVGGENLIDYFKRPDGDLAMPGGSPFNVAMGLGRQGANVTYVTPISTDTWGDMLYERLVSSDVKIGSARSDAPSSMAIVEVKDGIPDYEFKRDGTSERDISLDALKNVLPEDGKLFHIVGSLALAAEPDASIWHDLCDHVKSSGWALSLDPNLRLMTVAEPEPYRAVLKELLTKADIIKTSDEDLEGLFPELSFEDAMQHVLKHASAPVIVVTRGKEDGYAYLNGEMQRFSVVPADPLADTVGAGDTFMATLLASLSESEMSPIDRLAALTTDDLGAMLHRAAVAAALNCQKSGCEPPTFEELNAAL